MNYSLCSVPFYCAVLLPKRASESPRKCIVVYSCGISARSNINKALIPSLTIIGVLLQMLTILAMRGMSTSTMAIRTTTIRQITIMLGVLGQESKNV